MDRKSLALLCVRYRTLAAMLSLGEIAQIKAEIERLERLRKECTNSGIRNRIGTWIEGKKKKLTSDPSKEGTA
jgi:hypothetical protein